MLQLQVKQKLLAVLIFFQSNIIKHSVFHTFKTMPLGFLQCNLQQAHSQVFKVWRRQFFHFYSGHKVIWGMHCCQMPPMGMGLTWSMLQSFCLYLLITFVTKMVGN